VSLQYLKTAVAENDTEKLIRYVRLHLSDGNETAGRKEIDKAWIEALKLMLRARPLLRHPLGARTAESAMATPAPVVQQPEDEKPRLHGVGDRYGSDRQHTIRTLLLSASTEWRIVSVLCPIGRLHPRYSLSTRQTSVLGQSRSKLILQVIHVTQESSVHSRSSHARATGPIRCGISSIATDTELLPGVQNGHNVFHDLIR